MLEYRTSEDNKDYIVMENPNEFIDYLRHNNMFGNKTLRDANYSYKKLVKEIAKKDYTYKNLAIKKDSDLGRYICVERKGISFEDLDDYITFMDIENAYNISKASENPITPYLCELKVHEVEGKTEELKEKLGEEIVDYILDNKDYLRYIKITNNDYHPNDSIVYDTSFHTANLYEMNKTKQKVK